MDNKEKYRQLCKEESSICIFSTDWWMDAVCGEENWDVILVEENDEILAVLPYLIQKMHGVKQINQPNLTQKNGVWIRYPQNQKYSKKIAYENKIMKEIIDKLENINIDYYSQNFDYTFNNWLPFCWKGFKQSTLYTCVIEDISNLDKVFSNFSNSNKRDIKRAEKKAKVYHSNDIEKFYEINKKTFERQGLRIPYSLDYVKRINKACNEKKSGEMFFLENENGQIASVFYLIWDSESAYGLMKGDEPSLREDGFGALIIWEAIKFSSKVSKKFDFSGSMIEAVSNNNMKFGVNQKPYFNISKIYNKKYYFIAQDIYSNSPKIQKIYSKLRHFRKDN